MIFLKWKCRYCYIGMFSLDFKTSIMEVSTPMNIAQQIIDKVGGVAKVAKICGRTQSWVYKWTYPKERNGRGGIVPHEDAEALLAAAGRGEISVTPEDFFSNTAKVNSHSRT